MSQVFHPSMNAFARATIFGGVFVLAALVWAAGVWSRSSYSTQVDVVRDQPVPFSHDHHVAGLGIDCRYCHISVERSAFAGLPSTEICMGCHSQIWRDSELLAPVRRSYRDQEPLHWTRVHDLPDFVYFNHAIHVAKGIGCESCHGRVDRMPLMRKAESLHMEWCLECHRHPELRTRELADVFRFGLDQHSDWRTGNEPPAKGTHESTNAAAASTDGAALVKQYGIIQSQLTDCGICHR
jgi:hypothetical protein